MKRSLASLLALLLLFLLSSCAGEPYALQIFNYFDDQTVTLSLPRSLVAGDSIHETMEGASFMAKSKNSLNELEAACEKDSGFQAEQLGDNCIVLRGTKTDSKEIYLLLRATDYNYTFCTPYANLAERTDAEDGSAGKAPGGPYVYFPLHLLQYTSPRQMLEIAQRNLSFEEEYTLRGTPQEFKEFYVKTGRFEMKDTANGFILNNLREGSSSKMTSNYRPGCRFELRTENGVSYVTLHKS